MGMLTLVSYVPFAHRIFRGKSAQGMERELFGLRFRNPVGLAAGFDKNGRYLRELDILGFGHVEVGTVTPRPQPGNEKPRLFRLPRQKALLNRMGFNNDGVREVAARIRNWRLINASHPGGGRAPMIIGGNIGKNKDTPNEEAWKDYERCFLELADCVDYFVVNVSSPNTPGLRALQERDALSKILAHLQTLNRQQVQPRPILLKIAPDLTDEQLYDLVDLVMEVRLDGIVATNTTVDRKGLEALGAQALGSMGAGGISGRPLRERSTEILRKIYARTGGTLPLVASGGVFSAEDALEKVNAGASLVQIWTGFIYTGPGLIGEICRGLSGKMASSVTRMQSA